MKIYTDVLEDLTTKSYVIMKLLDFSPAFDTVGHNILVRRLKTEYGVGGIALYWLKSYLSNRSYKVKLNSQMLSLGLLRTQYLDQFFIHYTLKI